MTAIPIDPSLGFVCYKSGCFNPAIVKDGKSYVCASHATPKEAKMTWRLEKGDCLLPLTGFGGLGEKSVDHVITDPPYEAEAHTLQRRVSRSGGNLSVEPLDFNPISEEQRMEAATQIARVCRRWALVFCQIEAAMKWRRMLESAGMVYKRTCIWVKPDGMPQMTGDRPGMGYETIVLCHAPGRSRWNGGGKHGVFAVNKNDTDRSGHPTQKPDALMDMLVTLFTDYGETILDPFAGSGTTGVAAVRRGRNFIGWEMLDKYHAMALHRLSSTREQTEIFAPKKKAKQIKLFGGSNGNEGKEEDAPIAGVEEERPVSGDLLGERSGEADPDREGKEGGQVEGGDLPGVAGRDPEIPAEDGAEGDSEKLDVAAFGSGW